MTVDRHFPHKPTRTSGFETGKFKKEVELAVHAGGPVRDGAGLQFTVNAPGSPPGGPTIDAGYHTTSTMGQNYVDTGLYTFTQYDVMDNLEAGTISFRPAQATTS